MATFSSGDDYSAGDGISISSGGGGGGSDTGGYDVLGTGAVGDPTRGGQTIQDISGGSSDDQDYVNAIRANVNRQLTLQAIQRLQQEGLPQKVNLGFAAGTSPFAQLSARGNLNQLGLFGGLFNTLGKATASGIMERLTSGGGIPVYDNTGQIVGVRTRSEVGDKISGFLGDTFGFEPEPTYDYFGRPDFDINEENAIKDKFGNIIGYEAGIGFPEGDGDPDVGAGSTAVVVADPEPEISMIEQGLRYPEGFYPEEGRFLRTGLLDVAPTEFGGLLAGYSQPQFAEMNVGFRRPTDVGLFSDPYDMTGRSLLS